MAKNPVNYGRAKHIDTKYLHVIKWTHKIKCKASESIIKLKACLVATNFKQKYGVNFKKPSRRWSST